MAPQPGWPSLPVSPTLMRTSGSGLLPGSALPRVCAAICGDAGPRGRSHPWNPPHSAQRGGNGKLSRGAVCGWTMSHMSRDACAAGNVLNPHSCAAARVGSHSARTCPQLAAAREGLVTHMCAGCKAAEEWTLTDAHRPCTNRMCSALVCRTWADTGLSVEMRGNSQQEAGLRSRARKTRLLDLDVESLAYLHSPRGHQRQFSRLVHTQTIRGSEKPARGPTCLTLV